MSASLLRTHSLPSFIDAARDPDAFCLFLHIPKTAGSSLGQEIASHLRPYRNVRLDYLDQSLPHHVKRQRAVDALVAELEGGLKLRSASGHITMRQAMQVKRAHPPTRIVTFLRDPVARTISDYRYQRTPAHPLHADFIRRFPTIADYVRAEPSRDKMWKRLVARPTEDVAAGLELIERNVTFVGLVERYELSVSVLFRLFGVEVLPEAHVRRTQDTGENRVENTPDLSALILDMNRKDAALHAHFSALLEPRAAEWERNGAVAETAPERAAAAP